MELTSTLMTAATVSLAGIGGAVLVLRLLRDPRTACINTAIQNPVFALSFGSAFLALAAAAVFSWMKQLDSAMPYVCCPDLLYRNTGHNLRSKYSLY